MCIFDMTPVINENFDATSTFALWNKNWKKSAINYCPTAAHCTLCAPPRIPVTSQICERAPIADEAYLPTLSTASLDLAPGSAKFCFYFWNWLIRTLDLSSPSLRDSSGPPVHESSPSLACPFFRAQCTPLLTFFAPRSAPEISLY